MGNTGSSVEQHVQQARKTGVCSLKDHKLSQVGRDTWPRCRTELHDCVCVSGSRGSGDSKDVSTNTRPLSK